MLLVKEDRKKQSIKHHKQPEAYITNNQYEEPLEQKSALTVAGKKTYAEATKFGKKISVIGDSHLNRYQPKEGHQPKEEFKLTFTFVKCFF